jgi:[acyl-carrier-protein] S-malonyltransferase
MNTTAYIFPGQGSQYVGMGKDLCESFDEARKLFRLADDILGFPLSTVCYDGPEDLLKQTANTQPAIFLHSIAATRLLQHEAVGMTAGHSLGEYTALVYAGALTFEDGLRMVRLRGELMQRACEEQRGTMAAIVGLDPARVEECCRQASAQGIVQCANFNSPGQIVISGTVAGVTAAMELTKTAGAKMVKELVVSGAFHSPLMESARLGLQEALKIIPLRDAKIPVYANVTARGVQKAEEIRTLLVRQLISPVRWEESVRAMIADGASAFIEIGPGKVLQGLMKRIDASIPVSGVDKTKDVQSQVTV